MAFSTSSDPFKVYRGLEAKIKDEYQTPIVNGRVYFAYDSDKIFYDAQGVRHEISGGGDVSFIKAKSAPTFEGDTGYYVFPMADIEAKKLAVDNIVLAIDDCIYRVVIIDDETNVVKTKQIAGGGGGGGVTNPLTITTVSNFPNRTIDTEDVTCTIKVNSMITTDQTCMLQVFVNNVEVTNLGNLDFPLRTEADFTIPHRYYRLDGVNEVKFVATVDENTKEKTMRFYAFHSEFAVTDFNYRAPYGTDEAVTKVLNIGYSFTGLDEIYGHIHFTIDGEELWDLSNEIDQQVLAAGGGQIRSSIGSLTISCLREEFVTLEHGNHTLTLNAYAVVNNEEFFVNSVSYDIIWATEAGADTPIIISAYPDYAEEENYNIISIPYLIYAKNTEKIITHLYVNNQELATSPINYENKGYNSWQYWTVSKYTPNFTNTFSMLANVGGKTAIREFTVKITPSDLKLDGIADGLLLYLSAQDRSNAESALSRQTWTYTNDANNQTTNAQFSGFNWYNNGWQLDDDGDNVLRLNNGARVTIPFDQVLQVDMPSRGFTIETEFRCRNAINFAKLLTYSSKSIQDTDEYGNLLWETEVVYEEDGVTPKMKIQMMRDEHGQETDIPVQVVDARGHLAYEIHTGDDPETGEEIWATYYAWEDEQGNVTYWTKKNVQYADDQGNPIIPAPANIRPIYVYEEVTRNVKRDPNGADEASNWVPIMVADGAVTKQINYVLDDNGDPTDQVANAVGTFFGNKRGLCIGTQEAFFASRDITVNVRYADNDKVKISVVADTVSKLLYIYINAVLSGVERFSDRDVFSTGALGMIFNSDYCDLDLYTIRIYNKPLNFAEIVQNWVGDAPNLQEKRKRYQENSITHIDSRNGYVTLDYDLTRKLSKDMADNYKTQIALGNSDAQKGLPIAVISTYPSHLSNDTKSDLLPYNKAIKQYVDIRFWDPNGDVPSFKAQDFELSVQGTSSQGYPRRNYKAKLKATDAAKNAYANKYPFYFTTWDGNEDLKDVWPTFNYPDPLPSTATQAEKDAYDAAYSAAEEAGWAAYKEATKVATDEGMTAGYKKLKKIDIGNGTQETNFCFKADYMDSSSAHNTSLANFVTELCKYNADLTYPIKNQVGNPGNWRSTVYGFPMLVFWDHKGQSTAPEFVGRYNFNTDKSAISSFGFKVEEPHNYLHDVDYIGWTTEINNKGKKVDVVKVIHGDPTYADICECWELTSNQHGFTGFRRNDFDAVDTDGKLDFYNFFENRQHIADFDPADIYDEESDITVANQKLRLYANNIIDLSKWIYSTDIHPWDGEGSESYDASDTTHHKLTAISDSSQIRYRIINETEEEVTEFALLRDYYTVAGTKCTLVQPKQFKITKSTVDDVTTYIVTIYELDANEDVTETAIPASRLWVDEINATLDTPAFYLTRDEEPDVEWLGANHDQRRVNKTYYSAPDEQHPIPETWYKRVEITTENKVWDDDANNGQGGYVGTGQFTVVGYTTKIEDETGKVYDIDKVYEEYVKDTKAYRLAKYRAEFSEHLNFAYCAFYFILTEFMILYDSREKNMMIATWGPEKPGGSYIWYPIFYDMDTQLGINNSGTVFWDYDVNAQDDGLFSGAGSVLWDNFYACFIDEIKAFYRKMRSSGHFNLDECIKYYNTQSADRWTPIMKNIDAFYKYVAPSIDAPGLRYVTKQGDEAITASFFYCAQGDRTLNRSAFFRNRFNYKDSEWLGGSYQTQGGKNIEMRYDANSNASGKTSDPDAAAREGGIGASIIPKAEHPELESNATFDIKPYLTQYISVYYDELPREGGRYDIQFEPTVDVSGVASASTKLHYPKNWQNVKKDGFITVDPLPAIQETIDSGLELSQQLVYIYGPEYIRDLGDLSLKYLDRFFCGDAIRLNRLVIGNDNPLYKNDGMSGAFSLDTSYYSSFVGEDGTKKLNPNAKALLQYIDLSNLGGLSGGLDLSGCLKLNTLKARGTNYSGITVPEGNVIETLYLPASTQSFVQIQAQKLNKVIRNANLASDYEQKKVGSTQAVGLFIEKLTDRMNVSRDADIYDVYTSAGSEETHKSAIASYITSDPNYNSTTPSESDYMTHIDTFNIEGGKLGFISYELLDYILKQKIKARYDSAIKNDTPNLKLRLLDVAWTPYEKIDSAYEDDRGYTDNQYFIRTDKLTYEPLPASTTFEYANQNLGGIYRKTDNRLSIDGTANNVAEGIPNLKMLKMFVSDFNNANRTNTNPNNLYLVRDTYIPDNLAKRLPLIGGEIYVDNDEAISEYELYNLALTFTTEVLKMDPDATPLTICAKTVTECPRAKFIEIEAGAGDADADGIKANGTQKTIATYRSNDANADVEIPTDLIRNDYDFRGWATYEAIQEYQDSNKPFLSVDGNGVVLSNTGGVVATDSPILEHLAVTIDMTTRERTYADDASSLKFGATPTTYYAIFTLHKYEVRYILDKDAYDLSEGADPNSYESVLVPSNAYIDAYPPEHIPYFHNDTLPIGQMHKFLGWGISTDLKPRSLHYAIRKDVVFYPFYSVVNAYKEPLDANYFDWTVVNGGVVIYGMKYHVGGRICIPKMINNLPVTQILGSFYKIATNSYTSEVIQGASPAARTKVEGNGLQSNLEIEHVYFEGANDGTCNLQAIGQYAFFYAWYLKYVDLPDSLTQIDTYAFARCGYIGYANLNNVRNIGQYAFTCTNTANYDRESGSYVGDHVDIIYIDGDTNIGAGAFNGVGYRQIIIGSEGKPSSKSSYNLVSAGAGQFFHTGNPYGDTLPFPELVRLYSSVLGPSSTGVSRMVQSPIELSVITVAQS